MTAAMKLKDSYSLEEKPWPTWWWWFRRKVVSSTCDPWTVAHQALLSMRFSRQEYWSGLPFPSPGRSSQHRNQTQVSCIAGSLFTDWAMREAHVQSRQHIKKQRHYFANKGPSSQSYSFSSGHVWMWVLDYKEIWVLKNWRFEL